MKRDRFPQYRGSQWDRKITNPDNPNFWKYGVANLIFVDCIKGKKFVLDLGCGTGGSTIFLAQKADAERIIGVDLVSSMIKEAKKNVTGRLEQKVDFVICDARHLPFRPSRFDALISRGNAFCFLVPLKNAVQELKRVIAPKGVIVLEMDNRVDWTPGATISAGFRKTSDGKIAFVIERFTAKRDHKSVSYILNPDGKIARKVANDHELREKGYKAMEYSFQKIRKETVEIRHGARTHWPTAKELLTLFKSCGFRHVQVMGDGLLMKLLLDGDKEIVKAMKRISHLFFDVEKRLVPYVDANKAPTMILTATLP